MNFIDQILDRGVNSKILISVTYTHFGYIYKKKTSNFIHYYKQKLTIFKLVNTVIDLFLIYP